MVRGPLSSTRVGCYFCLYRLYTLLRRTAGEANNSGRNDERYRQHASPSCSLSLSLSSSDYLFIYQPFPIQPPAHPFRLYYRPITTPKATLQYTHCYDVMSLSKYIYIRQITYEQLSLYGVLYALPYVGARFV